MILDELVLHNVGVYKGRHSFPLTPKSKDKPIVLLGALNGSGKTTFLEALQLAFFGKLSPSLERSGKGYDQYLMHLINRQVPAKEGAAVEIEFRDFDNGTELTYRIHRSWRDSSGSVKERFEVLLDGQRHQFLTNNWTEAVEEIFPSRLAPLFFFDGEKIEEFAHFEKSARALSTAIHALLGLDIVEQLVADLNVFERRKRRDVQSDTDRKAIDALTEELANLEQAKSELVLTHAEANRKSAAAVERLNQAKQEFKERGGEKYQQREFLSKSLKDAEAAYEDAKNQLRRKAAGAAPLLLLQEQLNTLANTALAERETKTAQLMIQELSHRDAVLLNFVSKLEPDEQLFKKIKVHLHKDRKGRASSASRQCTLNLPAESEAQLISLQERELSELRQELGQLLQITQTKEAECRERSRDLNSVPDEEQIAPFIKAVITAEREESQIRRVRESIKRDLDSLSSQIQLKKRDITSLLGNTAETMQRVEDAARIISHVERANTTLHAFQQDVLADRLSAIELEILDSFRTLIRKEKLVSSVSINPDNFRITLNDHNQHPISANRLSAGERQLFAVSLIWALAKVSGRSMPTVIDTPLSRLDSVHREHLVKRYFPNASHQVLLLSTDEEIDHRYYAKIKRYVSHSFTMAYDESLQASRVEEGYAFDRVAA